MPIFTCIREPMRKERGAQIISGVKPEKEDWDLIKRVSGEQHHWS